jgi:hypothetical protein
MAWNMGSRLLSFIFAACIGTSVASHEFWIEPDSYQVETDATFTANLKNGENFSGVSLGWFERRFTRFEMAWRDEVFDVEGRMGDTPALQASTPPDDGLLIVLHETTPSKLTYRDWDKFLKFVAHKDFPHAVAEHEKNGWSKEEFVETYTRHVKALIAVGDGQGADRTFGMATEFTALTNPYADDFNNVMSVRLHFEGAPRPDAQVEVYDRAPGGDVTVALYRTDENGFADIPVTPGHDYLVDAVVLRPATPDADDARPAVWETLWAALTFSVPAR